MMLPQPPTRTGPFYLDDLPALREKLARAEHDATPLGQVWAGVRRRAQAAPAQFPWFVPFVGMVTERAEDLEAARQALRNYVATFPAQTYGMGLQFHFWCFAFPHARWSLYFQWLESIGAWEPAEAEYLRGELITFGFANFFYGMRTKPDPECVDNQTMSLCFCNAVLGQLYGQRSPTAARMGADGLRRLPATIGGMPPSGYSGEGSTYMDHVVGPSVPFIVELLERAHGGDWFSQALPPDGGSAESIVRMIAREWMPGGLVLPWDHYGYALPTRSCIAYGAYKTGDDLFLELLESHADWAHDVSIGWGYDDLIWSLLWWPDRRPATRQAVFSSWAAPDIGGALVADDSSLYLMQMWDHTTPGYPTRAHVNPNALVLSAWGVPLTTDGVPAKSCTAFEFSDTWRELTNMTFTPTRTNFGPGCAGAHGVLLVDGREGMRALTHYPQSDLVSADLAGKELIADVTPLYREHWPDAQCLRRRSRLVEERFWLVEDLAVFGVPHAVTARWYLRPEKVVGEHGVTIETAEGIRLTLLPLLGSSEFSARRIEGYPDRLDGASLQVDFQGEGATVRWLWLLWPERRRALQSPIADDWTVAPDPERAWEPATAQAHLDATSLRLPFTLPPFLLADLPVVPRWWYRRVVEAPAGQWWLRLPHLLKDAALWVNGHPIDLSPYQQRMELLAPEIALSGDGGPVEILVRTDCGISQYGKDGSSNFSGSPAVLIPSAGEPLEAADYCDGVLRLRAGGQSWQVAHELLHG
jgi:hypothetical protein